MGIAYPLLEGSFVPILSLLPRSFNIEIKSKSAISPVGEEWVITI
jgi:hypothetical protein